MFFRAVETVLSTLIEFLCYHHQSGAVHEPQRPQLNSAAKTNTESEMCVRMISSYTRCPPIEWEMCYCQVKEGIQLADHDVIATERHGSHDGHSADTKHTTPSLHDYLTSSPRSLPLNTTNENTQLPYPQSLRSQSSSRLRNA